MSSLRPSDRLAFGDFVLERSQERVRRRDGTALELPPRLFGALLLFIDRAGELLRKDELLTALWPGLVVEENNLSQVVHALRAALGDDRRPHRYIQTVPRRGFRFVAALERPAAEGAGVRDRSAFPPDEGHEAAVSIGNLPPPTMPLHGRAADLDAVAALLCSRPVVSIVGPGGIGKTRLALAAAAGARGSFRDGVWWIELAAVTQAALLASAVAGALGLQLPPGRLALDALAGALCDQQALLLLDNAEQIADGVAELVDAVRARAGALHFLVTSQKPVHAAAEQVFRLGPLALPHDASLAAATRSGAVALFVDRASAVEPRFGLGADNVATVVEICRLLDGIPLALELAAVRVPLLGVDLLLAKLGQRFKLLVGGAGTRPRRQQTLQAALDWSCGLLDDDERAVLRRLGVFVGGFSLGLAQAVAADSGIDAWQVLDRLGRLVDKSLVVSDVAREPRYHLLETTRAHALQLLDQAGEAGLVRRRHAEAMLVLLQQADAARWLPQPGADVAIRRELDNARAALDWSVADSGDPLLGMALHAASMPLWLAAGLKAEGAERCAALADSVDDRLSSATAARFWLTVAMMGLFSSRLHCLEAAERAARLFRAVGDTRGEYEALIVCTGVAARRSEHDLAAASLAAAANLVDPTWPARRRSALAFAGWVSALNARRAGVAVEHAWQEVALCRESGSAFDEAIALGRVGIAEINAPGHEAAGEARLREAADWLAAAGRPEAAGHVSYSLALALLRRGALDEALLAARRAYRLLRRDGEQALMLGLLPLLAVRRERYEAAARSAGYASAVYARAGLPSRGLFGEAVTRLQAVLPAEALGRLMVEGASLSEEADFALVLEDQREG
jgi:predicted ATPase/DNA-binding winged helix-turn-helix (wHTH) protein